MNATTKTAIYGTVSGFVGAFLDALTRALDSGTPIPHGAHQWEHVVVSAASTALVGMLLLRTKAPQDQAAAASGTTTPATTAPSATAPSSTALPIPEPTAPKGNQP